MRYLRRAGWWLVVLGAVAGLLFVAIPGVTAEMQPARIAVNHETRQCAEFSCGDECADCRLPEGWKVLGYAFNVTCPVDFEVVEIDPVWVPVASEFCCTPGHSGSSGDCSDVVKNQINGRCAFGEDIRQKCGSLPYGWTPHGGECSQWMDEEINCTPAYLPVFPGFIMVFLCLGMVVVVGVAGYLFLRMRKKTD